MLIGRSDDPHNPCRVVASKVALPFGSGSRNPSGPAAMCRNKQAGHTTATAPTQFFCLNPCIQGAVHTRPLFAPLAISDKISDPIQRVTVCFARMQGDTVIELVEPFGENSPVDSIIGSSRGGIYHLCYEVDDLDQEVARCRQKRCMPVSEPVPAAA